MSVSCYRITILKVVSCNYKDFNATDSPVSNDHSYLQCDFKEFVTSSLFPYKTDSGRESDSKHYVVLPFPNVFLFS